KMNAGAFHRWCEFDETTRFERDRALESQWVGGFVRSEKGQRDRRDHVLFAPETRPERRIDERLDRIGVGRSGEAGLAALPRLGDVAREVIADLRRDGPRRGVRRPSHRPRERRVDLDPWR